jgi:hypothetical protein
MSELLTHIVRRRKVERHAVIHDENNGRLRGEALHEVWWQGRQWAVTSYGIECLDGSYYIEAKRLCKEHNQEHPWSWIAQLGEKPEWVDISDFATAFYVAVAMHGERLSHREVDLLRGHYRRALGTALAHQEAQPAAEPRLSPPRFCEIGDGGEGE